MNISLLAIWVLVPMLAARSTRRSGLPRVALLALLLGLLQIIAGAALRNDPSLLPSFTLVPELFPNGAVQPDLVVLGLCYIGLSGVGFIFFGLGTNGQRNGFGLGFWLAHLGISALIAQSFGPLLPAPTAESLGEQIVLVNQGGSVAVLLGLLLMVLFLAFAIVKGKPRRPY